MKGDHHVVNNDNGGFKVSRTYRRKTTNRINWACDLDYFISDLVRVPGTYNYVSVYYATDSKEYKKGLARYHSDGATSRFKEPGPSFFRNLFSDRPLRRKAKNELRKFMISVPVAFTGDGREVDFLQVMNECYEPNIPSKGKLPYWT
jgi:hypothetical protein